MKRFLIKTLGCKVNSYESEFIRSLFVCNNFVESNDDFADVCIVVGVGLILISMIKGDLWRE